jgi:hypothetical protein
MRRFITIYLFFVQMSSGCANRKIRNRNVFEEIKIISFLLVVSSMNHVTVKLLYLNISVYENRHRQGRKTNKHDNFVQELYLKVRDEYDTISRNIPLFSPRGRRVGEIDLLCVKGNDVHIFEVKCSLRRVKARKQLTRLKKYLGEKNISYYFYCGSSQTVEEVE